MQSYEHREDAPGGEIFPATRQEGSHRKEADGNGLEQVSAPGGPRHRISTIIGKTRRGQEFAKERILIPMPT